VDLRADQLISHYRLIEQIGAGGMGIVWKALDTKLNRQVAIKILPPALTADEERRLRFQREAQTAAALSHPNVARAPAIRGPGAALRHVRAMTRDDGTVVLEGPLPRTEGTD
jgi:serine/threonine-protein kinase